jgi:hypothetical protein
MRGLGFLLLVSCAAPARSPTAAPPGEDIFVLSRELDEAEQELDAPSALATQADCGHACELERRICELAERICAIARRHSDDSDAKECCKDGRLRCERAHTRVRAQCTCLDRSGPPARSY